MSATGDSVIRPRQLTTAASDYVVQDDLMKAVRKQAEAKKHESGLDYKAV